MERKARIKVLRGDKSQVGTYTLQYGQPFYDTSTGQLYIGRKDENTEKTLNELPTVFQGNDGNIKIGKDFTTINGDEPQTTSNPKISVTNQEISLGNSSNIGIDIKSNNTTTNNTTSKNTSVKIGQYSSNAGNNSIIIGTSSDKSTDNIIKIGTASASSNDGSIDIGNASSGSLYICDGGGVHIGNNLKIPSSIIPNPDPLYRRKLTDVTIGNNITLKVLDDNAVIQLGDNDPHKVNDMDHYVTYSLYIGNKKLYYYGNYDFSYYGYILGTIETIEASNDETYTYYSIDKIYAKSADIDTIYGTAQYAQYASDNISKGTIEERLTNLELLINS